MWRQAHYRAAVETAIDSILVFDVSGVIQSINPATKRMFGYETEALVGKTVSVLIPATHCWWVDGALQAGGVLDQPNSVGAGRSVVGRRRNGSPIPIELSTARWKAEDGCRFFTWILRDVGAYRATEEALKENQAWLQTVSDTALAGLLVIDRHHCIRFANQAYAVLFHLTPSDLVGQHLLDVLPDLYPIVGPHVEGAFAGERRTYQTSFPEGDESTLLRTLSGTYARSRNAAGEEVVVVVVTDVTELKRNEMALRANRDLLQSVLDGTDQAIFAKDSRGRYVMANERGVRNIGKPRDAIIGRDDYDLFDTATAALYCAQDLQVARSGQPLSIDRMAAIEGELRRFIVTKQSWVGPDGLPGGIVGITRDVTEQHLMAIERDQVSKRLMQAQEAERLRIARELHDRVGQDLTGLSIGLKTLEAEIGTPRGAAQLKWLRGLTDRISRDLHWTALELRPTSLEDFGLRQAVISHVSAWSGRFGLRVDVELCALDGLTLPAEAQLAMYRCVQEALTNVLKHARASNVSVVAQLTSRDLRLIVEDDGSGFDADAPQARDASGGLGLLGMRERLGHAGGTLLIESTVGSGTTLFMSMPLEGRADS